MRIVDKVLSLAGAAIVACFIAVLVIDLLVGLYGLQLNAPLLLSVVLAVMIIVVVAGVLIGKDRTD